MPNRKSARAGHAREPGKREQWDGCDIAVSDLLGIDSKCNEVKEHADKPAPEFKRELLVLLRVQWTRLGGCGMPPEWHDIHSKSGRGRGKS